MIGIDHACCVQFTYERLPDFCYYCGCLGHGHKDCGKWLASKDEYAVIGFPYG